MERLERLFLEPVNTITHLIGAVGAFIGLLLLIRLTYTMPTKMISLAIYGSCQLLLYVSSCLLHGLRTTPKWNFFFNRLDHAAIFLMIAGVYTPIAYNLVPSPERWFLLTAVWVIASIGIFFKLYNRKIHGFLNASIYLLISWGAVLPIIIFFDITTLISRVGLILLISGGFIYSIGFIIYYWEWPDPWPSILGHHEIWHLFVMTASFLHFYFMLWEIVP